MSVRLSFRNVLCVLTFAILAEGVPAAQAQHMNDPSAPCRSAPSGAEFSNCLFMAAKTADTALNQTYRRIMPVLSSGERTRLKQAETLWIAYRNAECDNERDMYGGGTGGSPAYAACLEAETREHTRSLWTAYGWRVTKAAP